MKIKLFILMTIFLLAAGLPARQAGAALAEDYYINFSPAYPLIAGEETSIQIKSALKSAQVTAVFDNEDRVRLAQENGIWSGTYLVSKNLKSGTHQINIYFRQKDLLPITFWEKLLAFFRTEISPRYKENLIKKSLVIKIVKKEEYQKLSKEEKSSPLLYLPPFPEEKPKAAAAEDDGTTLEEFFGSRPSLEALPLKIKGSRIFAFSSKSIEGSKEGFLAGTFREESLRLNVEGKIDNTEIDANFFSASSLSTTQISTREEKVSILLKRGSSEAYLGDFTASLDETEFTKLDQVVSGMRLKGDYQKWGFLALAATPKGFPKIKRAYGNGTQGPYALGFSPVVIDSERIYVDRSLQKRGDDYTVDYNAGTITFLKKTIIYPSIIEAYFNHNTTVYQHSLYAFRGYLKPLPKLKVSATYLNDSDTLTNAAGIQSQTGINPAGHQVFGVDSSFLINENFTIDSEFALSDKNHNLLGAGTRESGTAANIRTSGSLGMFGILANYKRISPGFETIAAALPKKDLLDYGTLISFKPNNLFLSQAGYSRVKYNEAGTIYETTNQSFKTGLTPVNLPALEYSFFEWEDSNDPVTASPIRRISTRNRLSSSYQTAILNFSAKAEKERRLTRFPTEEATTYDIAGAGISTNPEIKKISAAANIEYKKTTDPIASPYSTKTYDLKLSANPDQNYLFSSSLQFIDDKKTGVSNVLDLVYQADPNRLISLDGKFTAQSVNETFVSSEARVSKQSGSFKFNLNPAPGIRLRYYYRPSFTLLDQSGKKIADNDNHQADFSFAFLKEAAFSSSYKTTDSFTVDRSTYPNLFRNSSMLSSRSNLFTLKAAPLSYLSAELNLIIDNSTGNTQTSTSAASSSYQKDNAKTTEYNLLVRTSLNSDFSIDSKYSHKTTQKGTEESIDNTVFAIDQTGSLKGIFTLNPFWRLTASGSFTESRDLLSSTRTYLVSPGIGFIYTYFSLLRIDGDYTYTKSFSAIHSVGQKLSLNGKYTLSKFVNLSLRYERETSTSPSFGTTDIAGIVEINL